jgi:membrane-associated phospholipid phosphatase
MNRFIFLAVYFFLIAATSLLIFRFSLPDVSLRSILRSDRRKSVLLSLAVCLFLIFTMSIVAWTEIKASSLLEKSSILLRKDYTHIFAGFERYAILYSQRISNIVLTYFFAYFYIIVWPSLSISSFLVYSYSRDSAALKNLFKGILLSIAVVLPFFLLFPVRECWVSGIGARFLMNDISPALEKFLRPFSGIDNCFPSYHVLMSFTVFFVAYFSNHFRLAVILGILASLVGLSTIYLGIHWISDVISGIMIALPVGLIAAGRPAAGRVSGETVAAGQ